MSWGAVILAGGRVEGELAAALGTEIKAMALVQGETCLTHVVRAVSAVVEQVVVVGPEEIKGAILEAQWVADTGRHIGNARAGVAALSECSKLLVFPSDCPLLSSERIAEFIAACEAKASEPEWMAIGLCEEGAFRREFPEIPCQSVRLKEGRFLAGAYYAVTPAAFANASTTIENLAGSRKSQIGMVFKLGFGVLWRYVFARINIAYGEQKLGNLLGCQAIGITGADPASMVDIDNLEDWKALQLVLERSPIPSDLGSTGR